MMNKLTILLLTASLATFTSCLNDDDIYNTKEQFDQEQAAIDQYLTEQGITAEIDSVFDLRYHIEAQGTGEIPEDTSYVTVSYTGKLLNNGSVFDEGDSVTFLLGGTIHGWRILLPYLRVGGEMTMYIPSLYGYGNRSVGDIPANSTMIFDVKLHRVETKKQFQERAAEELLAEEQKLIDEYLEENNLTAQVDTSESLRYIILEEGTGDYPTDASRVNVDYSGKFLENGNAFASVSDATFNLKTLISGWKILMPYVREGGTITMFLPSAYAYGPKGNVNIPGNSTLIFEVKLNEIVE